MSFLSELKSQASAVQAAKNSAQSQAQTDADARIIATEVACTTIWHYLSDMVHQLNILVPDGPTFSVDGKTPWPPMKLVDFRVDSRKKTHYNMDLFSSIGVGWEILPRKGYPEKMRVSVNFLPELQKAEARLKAGNIWYERYQVRHPEKQTVQAINFEFSTEARGSIHITPDHDEGKLTFRFCNVSGLAVQTASWPIEMINVAFLDELAKLVVSKPSRLLPTPD